MFCSAPPREISGIALSAIHALLPFGELQLEADILLAGIVQHHHRVIGGALLFRPHLLDGGAALLQKVGGHLLCQLLFAGGPEAVVLPKDKAAGAVGAVKILPALIDRLAAAGAETHSLPL